MLLRWKPSCGDAFRYLVTFIGPFSWHACVNIMRPRNQTLQKLEKAAEIASPYISESHNGTEITKKILKAFQWPKATFSVPRMEEGKSVSEQYNWAAFETDRNLLNLSQIPQLCGQNP